MSGAEDREAFARIYDTDEWTHGSGPGSLPENTIEYRAFLSRFLEANAITSVTDLGCGDWQFSRLVDWMGVTYLGLDVVPALIARNRARFSVGSIAFEVLTTFADLPGGDLCVCKDVLQHLPNASVADALAIIAKRYRFALIANDLEPEKLANSDIRAGEWRPLRLERAPFLARGAIVFSFCAQRGDQFWKKGVFLMLGDG